MQSEPTAVSQQTPPVDSPQSSLNSNQDGNDSDRRPVSGPLDREETGDPTLLDSSTPGADHPQLSDAGSALPSLPAGRVRQHEMAGSPGRKGAELGFRVVSSAGQSKVAMESLPNGTF